MMIEVDGDKCHEEKKQRETVTWLGEWGGQVESNHNQS